ncbi:hypothetical protein FB45DRAFT_899125 [Roridomyces roridus]|uniref:60S acidic ribosomal protein P1 n=1 Tax=Roridomyces roridus TaxID=1738132 RepID=A0AAD7FCW1_9AGAR|nr:hypothetical protein FB45DRAFT_1063882 [Roridomyces roridus]KAJ7644996.1 hypothetical protein FB45DRAFT_899125 [Roridomyces roridus]
MSNPTDLAATYAALILADADVEITASKILTLTTAANIELEPIWATLLAKALEGKNVKDMLSSVSVGTAPTGAVNPANPAKLAEAQTDKTDVKTPEQDPDPQSDDDSDGDMFGGGLFD